MEFTCCVDFVIQLLLMLNNWVLIHSIVAVHLRVFWGVSVKFRIIFPGLRWIFLFKWLSNSFDKLSITPLYACIPALAFDAHLQRFSYQYLNAGRFCVEPDVRRTSIADEDFQTIFGSWFFLYVLRCKTFRVPEFNRLHSSCDVRKN